MEEAPLPQSLFEAVLERLQVPAAEPNLALLQELYAAWCQRVPFDNILKLISIRSGNPASLPGSNPVHFLESWLAHGTGGTCWSGSGALLSVLRTLGFDAERALATMLVAPNLPPNHGSVRVSLDGIPYLVDSSILFGEPISLIENEACGVPHPAWGVQGRWENTMLHLRWRPLHQPEGFDCRFDSFGASHADYVSRYEETRGWSPFNYELTARINRGDTVIGISFGKRVTLHGDGSVETSSIAEEEKRRLLVEDFGIDEAIVAQMPEDVPTPPPPGSKTAATESTPG